MTYDPKKRDSSWQMVQPGCYIDPAGYAHLFPDEILAFLQTMYPQAGFDPNSKQDYDLVVETFMDEILRQHPDAKGKFIRHDRAKN